MRIEFRGPSKIDSPPVRRAANFAPVEAKHWGSVMRSRVGRLIERLSAEIEAALWAALIACAIFFCAVVVPRIPTETAKAQSAHILSVADENHRYCAKWGKPEGTPEHDACLLDLQALRGSIEKRFAASVAF